jgi:hypothetical protein
MRLVIKNSIQLCLRTFVFSIYSAQAFKLHRLLLMTIKRATVCMNQRPIKRRDMHVDGFDSELHETRIQHTKI